jgi:hypothetical protein
MARRPRVCDFGWRPRAWFMQRATLSPVSYYGVYYGMVMAKTFVVICDRSHMEIHKIIIDRSGEPMDTDLAPVSSSCTQRRS